MEEYFDVLDCDGNKTDKKKLRSEVHRDGDWHRAVYVWIVNSKGEVLMQKRAPNKDSHPNCWDTSVAGHLVAGTTSKEGAVREIEEELGLEVNENELEFLFSYEHATVQKNGTFKNSAFYDDYLLEKDLEIDKLTLQDEEVSEVKWVSIGELEEAINKKESDFVPHMAYPKLFKILKERYGR